MLSIKNPAFAGFFYACLKNSNIQSDFQTGIRFRQAFDIVNQHIFDRRQ
ncbi:hypothetical protein HMPREF9370_0915 [Neisseria wadsworthii 9715]|uniref:Uncharacterized protein n=1 Tax=Neisseria wadsworthii 9715 TaxID=1030841 RepID=G4CPA5_9NEIS|nr:hypothetical protein HMPREF9370_0915 [Neisseria wadsworthii 9715]